MPNKGQEDGFTISASLSYNVELTNQCIVYSYTVSIQLVMVIDGFGYNIVSASFMRK